MENLTLIFTPEFTDEYQKKFNKLVSDFINRKENNAPISNKDIVNNIEGIVNTKDYYDINEIIEKLKLNQEIRNIVVMDEDHYSCLIHKLDETQHELTTTEPLSRILKGYSKISGNDYFYGKTIDNRSTRKKTTV